MRDLAPYFVILLGACTAHDGADAASVDTALARCEAGVLAGCPCDGTVTTVCGNPDYVCSAGTWVIAADVCGELDTGARGPDAGVSCDGGAVAQGCPCDGSQLTLCGADIDYVCSHGTWFGHAGLCAMLDAGMPCADEGRISCPGGHGTVCCYGQEQTFFDGPCGAFGDGGVACGDLPVQGCPCDADAGASTCDGSQRFTCTDGTWQSTPYACGSLCGSSP